MIEKIKDSTHLVKVDQAFVINTDDEAYTAALRRRKKQADAASLSNRMDTLETKMDAILDLLQRIA